MARMICLLILLTLTHEALAWNEPTGFRDIPFGASERDVLQKFPSAQCLNSTVLDVFPERFCSANTTVGMVPVTVTFWFRSTRFTSVTLDFKSEKFNALEESFIARYGQPTTVREEPVGTLSGLHTTNRDLKWWGHLVHITLLRFVNTITDGVASISTLEEVQEQLRRSRERGKSGAKDL